MKKLLMTMIVLAGLLIGGCGPTTIEQWNTEGEQRDQLIHLILTKLESTATSAKEFTYHSLRKNYPEIKAQYWDFADDEIDASFKNWYLKNYPQTPEREAIIREGEIRLGMDTLQVRASKGTPININSTVGSWGVHEQWKYGYIRHPYSWEYLYFENGILTSWQR